MIYVYEKVYEKDVKKLINYTCYDYYNSRTYVYMCICARVRTHAYTHPTLRVGDET